MPRHAPLTLALLAASHAFLAGRRAPRRAARVSLRALGDDELAWRHQGEDVCYYRNQRAGPKPPPPAKGEKPAKSKSAYTLTFTLTLSASNECVAREPCSPLALSAPLFVSRTDAHT